MMHGLMETQQYLVFSSKEQRESTYFLIRKMEVGMPSIFILAHLPHLPRHTDEDMYTSGHQRTLCNDPRPITSMPSAYRPTSLAAFALRILVFPAQPSPAQPRLTPPNFFFGPPSFPL